MVHMVHTTLQMIMFTSGQLLTQFNSSKIGIVWVSNLLIVHYKYLKLKSNLYKVQQYNLSGVISSTEKYTGNDSDNIQ